jgi:hypothetical protein
LRKARCTKPLVVFGAEFAKWSVVGAYSGPRQESCVQWRRWLACFRVLLLSGGSAQHDKYPWCEQRPRLPGSKLDEASDFLCVSCRFCACQRFHCCRGTSPPRKPSCYLEETALDWCQSRPPNSRRLSCGCLALSPQRAGTMVWKHTLLNALIEFVDLVLGKP